MEKSTHTGPDTQRSKSVLVAEDDPDMRKLLVETLRAEGFTVMECADGIALIEALVSRLEAGEQPFDLVVSDVQMPSITGLSVLGGLSEWEELRSLPMVLITAFGDPRLHELARKFGAVSVLEKPFPMTTLMRIVREAIGGGDTGSVIA